MGERRGEEGDGEDSEDDQRGQGADGGARRRTGRENTLAPRLPDEQCGERAGW